MHIIGDAYLGTYTPASASSSFVAISSDDAEEMAVTKEHFSESLQPRPLIETLSAYGDENVIHPPRL